MTVLFHAKCAAAAARRPSIWHCRSPQSVSASAQYDIPHTHRLASCRTASAVNMHGRLQRQVMLSRNRNPNPNRNSSRRPQLNTKSSHHPSPSAKPKVYARECGLSVIFNPKQLRLTLRQSVRLTQYAYAYPTPLGVRTAVWVVGDVEGACCILSHVVTVHL